MIVPAFSSFEGLRPDLVSAVKLIVLEKEKGLRPLVQFKNFSPFALELSAQREVSIYRFTHSDNLNLWFFRDATGIDFAIPYSRIRNFISLGIDPLCGFSKFNLSYLWDKRI